MKVSSRMIFTMALVDSFTQMVIITLAIGLMGSGQATANLSTRPAVSTKASGNSVNSWENENMHHEI